MGNILSFVDIYEKTYYAAENGDFLTVVYQVARLVRRLMDFKSMQREALVKDVIRLTGYLKYYASLEDDDYSVYKRGLPEVAATPQDYITTGISIFTGFVDGSFRARNTSSCRKSLKLYTGSFSNATEAIFDDRDENKTVWYLTRTLKYMHPSAFHCYYAGKETSISFYHYLTATSWKDIMYNVVYKTGKMAD